MRIFTEKLAKYYQNPTQQLFEEIQECLWSELWAALKGLSQLWCKKTHQRFVFRYALQKSNADELPDTVLWNGEEKDFSEALLALFNDYSDKIRKRMDLKALLLGSKDRIKWIRSSLGLVLNNKVFNSSISRYQGQKRKVRDSILNAANLSKGDFHGFVRIIVESQGHRFYEICEERLGKDNIYHWYNRYNSEVSTGDCIGKLNINDPSSFLTDIPSKMSRLFMSEWNQPATEEPLEKMAKDFGTSKVAVKDDDHAHEQYLSNLFLKPKQKQRIYSQIEKQLKAFLWTPGQPLNGYSEKDICQLCPVYIAFFIHG